MDLEYRYRATAAGLINYSFRLSRPRSTALDISR